MILFLAANPSGTDRLALDREARSIYAELKRSGYRDRFDFETRWAVEPLDLLRELRELKPTVVHFSGHGGARTTGASGAAHGREVVVAPAPSSDEADGLYFLKVRDGVDAAQLILPSRLPSAWPCRARTQGCVRTRRTMLPASMDAIRRSAAARG